MMLNSECLNKFNAALNYQNKNKIVIKVKAQNNNNKQVLHFKRISQNAQKSMTITGINGNFFQFGQIFALKWGYFRDISQILYLMK